MVDICGYISLYCFILADNATGERRLRTGDRLERKDGLYNCYIGKKELLGNCFTILMILFGRK